MADQKKQNTTLAALGMALLSVPLGAVGDYYLDKDINLIVTDVTGYEYSQIKPEMITRLKDNKSNALSPYEYYLGVGVLNREVKKCGFAGDDIVSNGKVDVNKIIQKVDEGC